jgi:hypothetical protein
VESTTIAVTSKQTISAAPPWPVVSTATKYVEGAASASANAVWNATKSTSDVLNKAESSTPGQIVLNTMSAAGSEFATGKATTALNNVSNVTSAADAYRTGGVAGLSNQAFEQTFVTLSGNAGEAVAGRFGGAVAAATATASFEIGEHYIAPAVAPTVGTWMYNLDPKLFNGN